MTYKKVKVTWVDTTFFSITTEIDNLNKIKNIEITSIGYLIKKDKEKIIIAMSITNEEKITDFYSMPIGCVKKIEVLK